MHAQRQQTAQQEQAKASDHSAPAAQMNGPSSAGPTSAAMMPTASGDNGHSDDGVRRSRPPPVDTLQKISAPPAANESHQGDYRRMRMPEAFSRPVCLVDHWRGVLSSNHHHPPQNSEAQAEFCDEKISPHSSDHQTPR